MASRFTSGMGAFGTLLVLAGLGLGGFTYYKHDKIKKLYQGHCDKAKASLGKCCDVCGRKAEHEKRLDSPSGGKDIVYKLCDLHQKEATSVIIKEQDRRGSIMGHWPWLIGAAGLLCFGLLIWFNTD